ncbi:MAG: hypothetical protein K1X48_01315 [Burkholderiaceae bacterium]|nr:hypothetical protein [Burkholderiaceae bacterium]
MMNLLKVNSLKLLWFSAVFGASVTGAYAATPPTVPLATVPLFRTQTLPPNLVLNLAINSSTTGGAYRYDAVFVPTETYIGYFNPDRCYTYDAVKQYFVPSGSTSGASRTCSGKFSGNFMNWATMSTVDILRYSFTGGKRDPSVDSPSLTVLERSKLLNSPSGSDAATVMSDILLPTYFPRKTISLSSANSFTPYANKPGTLRIVNCGKLVHFGDGTGGSITNCFTPNGDGNLSVSAMQVKVQVCDAGEALSRTTLPSTNPPVNPLNYVDTQYRYCTQYGANYKPEGELQRNALAARISVFAYPNIDDPAQYGGVLRAPAKFVGPRRLDAMLAESANPNKEWDENTGVFVLTPDAVGAQFYAGLINYINKFEEAHPFYTNNNPVGELYYDSIRYLANQGSGWFPGDETRLGNDIHTNPNYAGFVGYKNSWTDPIMASCQNHYALTIGSARTAWDRSLPGGVSNDPVNDIPRAAPDAMGLNARAWTGFLFNQIGPGVNQGINVDATAGVGNAGYYFAGASYWARSTGFRPRNDGTDKRHTLTSFFMDWQEPAPDLINKRPYYFAAIGGAFIDKNNNKVVDANEWPYANGIVENSKVTTEGQTFTLPAGLYLAQKPRNMVLGIKDVFAKLTLFSGNLAGLALSTPLFNPADTSFIQTGLEAKNWSGQVFKYYLRQEGSENPLARASTPDGAIDDAPAWEAGELLTAKPATNRKIFAGRSDAQGRLDGAVSLSLSNLAGSWTALSAWQRTALAISPDKGEPDEFGRDRLAFLLGDRTTEMGQTCNSCLVPALGQFRVRSGVLGDIVNGGAVIVGKPGVKIGEPGYAAFASQPAVAKRPQMVYVAANDGMLHAFDGKTGDEKFAYMPNAVFPALSKLTAPTYIHRPFVDGPLLVTEANTTNGWKTVLAGTFGAGAQGVMALDVTDPEAFGVDKVMWEFTDKDDPDIGNINSQPKIAKVKRNGKTEYFIVVSGGYNNYQDDGKSNNVGDGYIFMLSLNKPQAAAWALGDNYFKFKLPITDAAVANGVGGVSVDTDNAGFTTALFAGDLQGNLWKVIFPSDKDDPSFWKLSHGDTPFAIFSDPLKGERQPVMAEPTLVAGPGKTTVVVVGTGRLLTTSDLGDTQPQTVYGIWDVNNKNVSGTNARTRLKSRSVWVDGTLRVIGYEDVNALKPEPDFVYGDKEPSKQGWYFDLPDFGEKMVFSPTGLRSVLFANSIAPPTTPCSTGTTWTCPLDGVMGRTEGSEKCTLSQQLAGKATPVALPVDLSSGGLTRSGLAKGMQRIVSLASVAAGNNDAQHATPIAQKEVLLKDRRWRQMNWREIINWLELRNNPQKTLP